MPANTKMQRPKRFCVTVVCLVMLFVIERSFVRNPNKIVYFEDSERYNEPENITQIDEEIIDILPKDDPIDKKLDKESNDLNELKYSKFYGDSPKHLSRLTTEEKHCHLPKLLFISHHKTGGYLKQWMPTIASICFHTEMLQIAPEDSCDIDESDFIKNNEYHNLVWLRGPRCFSYIISKPVITKYLILFMLRSPIDHILSGYNYHATGHEKVWWLIMRKRYFRECMINVFDPNGTDIVIKNRSTSMYDEYAKSYSDWNNHELLKHGLYLEFTRYYNCVWKQRVNGVYQLLKSNEDKVNFIFIRFDWFHDDENYKFRESMRYLLMKMGIDPKNPPANKNNLLASPGLRSNVVKLYINLLKWDWRNMKHWQSQLQDHTTRGKYNRSLQVQLLLSDTQICNKLKELTHGLDFEWKYGTVC